MTNHPVPDNGGDGHQHNHQHHHHHHHHHRSHHDAGKDTNTKVGDVEPMAPSRTTASLPPPDEDGWMDVLDNFLHHDHEPPIAEAPGPCSALPTTQSHHGCRTIHEEGCRCHPGADGFNHPKGHCVEDAILIQDKTSGESSLEVGGMALVPKRSSSGISDGDHEQASAEDGSEHGGALTALSRSERKRNREKQRRSDVNSQLAALASLLRRIEAEDLEGEDDLEAEDSERGTTLLSAEGEGGTSSSSSSAVDSNSMGASSSKRRRKTSVLGVVAPPCPTNRVDLIARTISVLDRLHSINTERKKESRELRRQVAESKQKAAEVSAKLKEAELTSDIAKQQGKVMMMMPMMVPQDATGGMGFPSFANPSFMAHAAFCQLQQQQAAAAVAGPTSSAPGPGAAQQAPAPATAAPAFPGLMAPVNPASAFASPMAVPAGANMFPTVGSLPFFAPVPQAASVSATPAIPAAPHVANPLLAGQPVGVLNGGTQLTTAMGTAFGNPVGSLVPSMQADAGQLAASVEQHQQPQGQQQQAQAVPSPQQQQQVGGSCGGELAHCA